MSELPDVVWIAKAVNSHIGYVFHEKPTPEPGSLKKISPLIPLEALERYVEDCEPDFDPGQMLTYFKQEAEK